VVEVAVRLVLPLYRHLHPHAQKCKQIAAQVKLIKLVFS